MAEHGSLPAVWPAARCHARRWPRRRRTPRSVAASVFNSGILAKDDPDPSDRYEYGALPSGVWDRLQRIRSVCREFGVSLPAAAVQFPLRNALVESVVVGASRPEQLHRNMELMTSEIPDGFWDALTFVASARQSPRDLRADGGSDPGNRP